jgi:hypothetical protein
MADQFQLGSAAAQVFGGWVDEKDANVILGAGPAVGGDFVLHGVVAVFVLDGVLIVAGAQDPLFLGMDDDARAPVLRGAFEQVAVGVHRDPIEVVVELGDVAVFAITGCAAGGRMGVNRVGVNAAEAARQRVAKLNANAPARGAITLPPVTPLTETSARSPPFFAGSIVRLLAAPDGDVSQYPPPPMVLMP